MSITIGNQNPRIYGGVDAINSGKQEIKVDPAEKNEGLKDIENVEVQGPLGEAEEAEAAPESPNQMDNDKANADSGEEAERSEANVEMPVNKATARKAVVKKTRKTTRKSVKK